MVKGDEEQLRNELLPLAADDARWLAQIHQTKDTVLETKQNLSDLARFLDGNLIMNYLNGKPWYDIHPLLIEEIRPYHVQRLRPSILLQRPSRRRRCAAGTPRRYLSGAHHRPEDPAAGDPGRATDRAVATPAQSAPIPTGPECPGVAGSDPCLPRPVTRAANRLAGGQSAIPGPAQRAARAPAPHPDQASDPVLHLAEKARIKNLAPDLWPSATSASRPVPGSPRQPPAWSPSRSARPSNLLSGSGNGCRTRAAPNAAPSSPAGVPTMPCCGVVGLGSQ